LASRKITMKFWRKSTWKVAGKKLPNRSCPVITVICKVGQRQHQKPVFGPFMGCNFKDGTKNDTRAQWGLKLRFCTGFSLNWVSCWLSFLCIAWRSPCLITFLPLCLHLHFSSHLYLYACNGFWLA
jgi:hypothetical protein